MSVFVQAQGIKTVHAGGGGVKKWQNSVHVVVVVECSLTSNKLIYIPWKMMEFVRNIVNTRTIL